MNQLTTTRYDYEDNENINPLNTESNIAKILFPDEDEIIEIIQNKEEKISEEPSRQMIRTDSIIAEINRSEKSCLLENLNSSTLTAEDSKKDYILILFWISMFCEKKKLLAKILEMSTDDIDMKNLCLSGFDKMALISDQEFNTKVILAAIRQKERFFLCELLKMESLQYYITTEIIVSLIQNNFAGLIKALFRCEKANSKSIFAFKSSKLDGYFAEYERRFDPEFIKSAMSGCLSHNNNQNIAAEAKLKFSPDLPKRQHQQTKHKIQLTFEFKDLYPFLIQLNRADLIDEMIELLGEQNKNHLDLFLQYDREDIVLKYYKKDLFDLTPKQVLVGLQKHFFEFLCNITDKIEQYLFFLDEQFDQMMEILKHGEYLFEISLILQQLPFSYWRPTQGQQFLEICKDILNQDSLANRLIFSSNPILGCSFLSYIMKHLSKKRFDFFKQDFLQISEKLENLSLKIQKGMPQKNLTILYLMHLPTGKNMLYYVVNCKIHSLVESQFVKTLIYEFWNQLYTRKGKREDLSMAEKFFKKAKRFEWTKVNSIQLDMTKNYMFQLQSTVISAKINIIVEIVFLLFLYFILEQHVYMKLIFFDSVQHSPDDINRLPKYELDVDWFAYPIEAAIQLFVFVNYWIAIGYKLLAFYRNECRIPSFIIAYAWLFIMLTIVLIFYIVFDGYSDQVQNQILITAILVVARLALVYSICALLLMFKGLGTVLRVVLDVGKQFFLLVVLVSLCTLFIAEYFQNFYRKLQSFNTVGEAYFSLIEMLFGSLTFPNYGSDVNDWGYYYAINISMTLWTFFSNVAFIFLLIAYMTKIYNTTLQDAEYKRTKFQYHIINFHSNMSFKGFYIFPPMISIISVPFFIMYEVSTSIEFKSWVNKLLIKFHYYLVIVPWIIVQELFYFLIISLPRVYIKGTYLLISGKVAKSISGNKILRLSYCIFWMIFGIFFILFVGIWDMSMILRAIQKNQDIEKAKLYILGDILITNDDDLYAERYKMIKIALQNFIKDKPKARTVSLDDLLNYILKNLMGLNKNEKDIKIIELSPKKLILHPKKKIVKTKLAEIIKKQKAGKIKTRHEKAFDTKELKGYIKALDNMLDIKNIQYKSFKEAEFEVDILQELLNDINLHSVVYLKLKRISLIQAALIHVQDADLITVLKRLDDVEDKLNFLISEMKNANYSK